MSDTENPQAGAQATAPAATPGQGKAGAWVRGMLLALGLGLAAFSVLQPDRFGGSAALAQRAALALGLLVALAAALPLRFGERLLLCVFTVGVGTALLEVFADRMLTPLLRPPYRFDQALIFSLAPNRESVFRRLLVNGGEPVTHRINAYGYRGAEIAEKSRTPRVVVYGDSFIHAAYSADAETFASQLKRVLDRAAGHEVEVINAGVSSYGPDQVSVALQRDLPRLRPDVVIVSIYAGNDYGDLVRNKMFRLDASSRLTRNDWQLDPEVRRRLDLNQRELMLFRAARALRQRFSAARTGPNAGYGGDAVRQFSDRAFLLEEAQREYASHVRDADPMVRNTHVDYFSADVSLKPDSESARYKVALMQAVLARIRDTAQSHGAALVFMVIPHASDVTHNYDSWGDADMSKYPGYRNRNLTDPIEQGARALGVPVVNLQDAFGQADAHALYFTGGDDHWNAAGQKLAAEVAGAFVASTMPRRLTPASEQRAQ